MDRSTAVLLVGLTLFAACAPVAAPTPDQGTDVRLRVASYNVSLYSEEAGGLIRRLEAADEKAHAIAAVIQQVRPDLLLLNEFDFDPEGRAAALFLRDYLGVAHAGVEPIDYPYLFAAPVNTGTPSGLDLDHDGYADGPNDAWGYGHHPGQYGMLVLSRHPIDAAQVRSFQNLRWATMPGARRPRHPDGTPYHSDSIWQQLRLSSKSHWDVPVETPLGRIHFLVSHPTPPVFDGPENRNGVRNFDEIRLFAEYITPGERPWLCDDTGRCGPLEDRALFVLAGDQNADPHDGEGEHGAIAQWLQHPRVDARQVPRSEGAQRLAARYGLARQGDPATHTGDFGPRIGTFRLDYVLPSRELPVSDSGVFWPVFPPEHVTWSEASDHHLVWVDLGSPTHPREGARP